MDQAQVLKMIGIVFAIATAASFVTSLLTISKLKKLTEDKKNERIAREASDKYPHGAIHHNSR